MTTSQGVPRTHDEAFELIPWLVNGRLSSEDRDGLERHLVDCEDCRREVDAQRRLRTAIRQVESNIEYAPQASFQKLWARIEESDPGAVSGGAIDHQGRPSDAPAAASQAASQRRRWMMAAATVLAVGLGLLVASQWRGMMPDGAAAYRTVTTPPVQPDRAGQIRAVFSPSVTVEELTSMVSENRLTIVGGPSDSGVYTLAVQPGEDLPVADAIARLRSDPRVRFAEPVVAASRGTP
jgi:hypothetical protein